jgi:hypothetical protein
MLVFPKTGDPVAVKETRLNTIIISLEEALNRTNVLCDILNAHKERIFGIFPEDNKEKLANHQPSGTIRQVENLVKTLHGRINAISEKIEFISDI